MRFKEMQVPEGASDGYPSSSWIGRLAVYQDVSEDVYAISLASSSWIGRLAVYQTDGP